MSDMQVDKVIIGCGYVGNRLIARAGGACFLGVARSVAPKNQSWLSLDLDNDCLSDLARACNGRELFYFAPPAHESDLDLRSRRFLTALREVEAKPKSIVLISTTGVYGDCAGSWVDENYPVAPTTSRSKRRLDAEREWARFAGQRKVALAVLRVAGIYGPSKLPLERLDKNQPLCVVKQSPYSNRVHVDDLIDTVMKATGLNETINVGDGRPSTMTEYFHTLADCLGVPRLPELARDQLWAELSEPMRAYMSESRRLNNARMLALLGGRLRYPALASGIEACLKEATQR